MTEELSVTTERVDDIPLLLASSDKMGVPELLVLWDAQFCAFDYDVSAEDAAPLLWGDDCNAGRCSRKSHEEQDGID